ncbi:hypothetical protein AAFF_G00171860 [Aldrovandia affinis]|uniref:Uncharacterized protein n=1 Tax=Aldrovandia affinis TaxID=143900 RepID=A0AAD7WW44_9TELE|nr:hypothetical protein AAFF_G00171860 [Aldrovandia affinis]
MESRSAAKSNTHLFSSYRPSLRRVYGHRDPCDGLLRQAPPWGSRALRRRLNGEHAERTSGETLTTRAGLRHPSELVIIPCAERYYYRVTLARESSHCFPTSPVWPGKASPALLQIIRGRKRKLALDKLPIMPLHPVPRP